MSYIALGLMYLVSIDLFVRIIVYKKTGNEKAKHKYIWWK